MKRIVGKELERILKERADLAAFFGLKEQIEPARQDNILVVDTNLAIDHALSAARSKNKPVYYYIPWQTAFPVVSDYISGDGFNELIKVMDIAEALDKVDTVIFVDVGFAALIEQLREHKFNVWGAPPAVERLETDRVYMRKVYKELGIKTTEAEIVKGVNGVLDYLEKHQGEVFFIKVNLFRGNVESFRTDSVESARTLLESGNFGPYADKIDFVIEKAVEEEAVEIGVDAWFNGEKFLKKHFFTMEDKGSGNIGKFVEESIFTEHWLKPLEKWLKEQGFKGSICIEGFWTGKEFLAIDTTSRISFPCSASWAFGIKDYWDFLKGVASGSIDDFEYFYPYQVEIGVYTDEVDRWRKLSIEEGKLRERELGLGFRRVVKTEDGLYYVPGDFLVATGLGAGSSIKEALERAAEAANSVSSYNIQPATGVIDNFLKKIEQLRKWGVGY